MEEMINELLKDSVIVTLNNNEGVLLYLSLLDEEKEITWTKDKEDACIWNDKALAENFCIEKLEENCDYTIRNYVTLDVE